MTVDRRQFIAASAAAASGALLSACASEQSKPGLTF